MKPKQYFFVCLQNFQCKFRFPPLHQFKTFLFVHSVVISLSLSLSLFVCRKFCFSLETCFSFFLLNPEKCSNWSELFLGFQLVQKKRRKEISILKPLDAFRFLPVNFFLPSICFLNLDIFAKFLILKLEKKSFFYKNKNKT